MSDDIKLPEPAGYFYEWELAGFSTFARLELHRGRPRKCDPPLKQATERAHGIVEKESTNG